MNAIDWGNLRTLADMDGEYVVSIYLPATTGAEQRQNPTRFKSLLRTAVGQMQARGIGEPAIQKMSATARTLLDQEELWKKLAKGLSVFVSRDTLHVLPLQFQCNENCFVGKCAYLLPLIAWASGDATYYVLAASRNSIRLLRGTRSQLDEVPVTGLPKDLASALHYDTRQGTLQMHSGQTQFVGKEGVVYHGQGGEVDVAKIELVEYFREIDRVVCEYLRRRSDPLVFAGVDYLFPIYRSVNNYAHLVPSSVEGNPELFSEHELCEKSWPLVASWLAACKRESVAQTWNSIGPGRTLEQRAEILTAAEAGAVESLFISSDAKNYARGYSAPFELHPRRDARFVDAELTNQAAVWVLRSGGKVGFLAPDQMPVSGNLAAVLRYPQAPLADESQLFHDSTIED